MKNDGGDDIVGFVVGFLLGCLGVAMSLLFGRRYLRGAIVGYAVRALVAVLVSAAMLAPVGVQRGSLNGGTFVRDVPWELVLAFVIVTVFGVALIGGAIWAFGGRDDDDDDEGGEHRSPEDIQYVTFSRD